MLQKITYHRSWCHQHTASSTEMRSGAGTGVATRKVAQTLLLYSQKMSPGMLLLVSRMEHNYTVQLVKRHTVDT